jgi:hypothetical protein
MLAARSGEQISAASRWIATQRQQRISAPNDFMAVGFERAPHLLDRLVNKLVWRKKKVSMAKTRCFGGGEIVQTDDTNVCARRFE